MSETTRTKNVVETIITDDDVSRISNTPDICIEKNMSKAATKAFRKAKKVSEIENARARGIVSALRAKREGADAEPIAAHNTPQSTSGQASIFDFLVDKMGDGGR